MSAIFLTALLSLCFAGKTLSASEKCVKGCTGKVTHVLSYETMQNGAPIKALHASLGFNPGRGGQHTAKYENGQIVTLIGNVQNSSDSLSLHITGEQIVTMNNLSGGVCFTSVSKDWEIRDSYVVHHHDGFEVHTKKNKQYIVPK